MVRDRAPLASRLPWPVCHGEGDGGEGVRASTPDFSLRSLCPHGEALGTGKSWEERTIRTKGPLVISFQMVKCKVLTKLLQRRPPDCSDPCPYPLHNPLLDLDFLRTSALLTDAIFYAVLLHPAHHMLL